jgi:hypothetical protein
MGFIHPPDSEAQTPPPSLLHLLLRRSVSRSRGARRPLQIFRACWFPDSKDCGPAASGRRLVVAQQIRTGHQIAGGIANNPDLFRPGSTRLTPDAHKQPVRGAGLRLAGPPVRHRDPLQNLLAFQCGDLFVAEVPHQRRNIVGAFAQCRQRDREHVEAVEQIRPERALPEHLSEVTVGCRDHPYIRAKRMSASQTFEFVLLQHPQQLGLQLRRNVADFVQEQRPPLASSNRPIRCASAPVNAPRSWPNNSLSRSPSGIAAQFTFTKGRSRRPLNCVSSPPGNPCVSRFHPEAAPTNLSALPSLSHHGLQLNAVADHLAFGRLAPRS